MREFNVSDVIKPVRDLCIEANTLLPADVKRSLLEAKEKEESPVGAEILAQIAENIDIACSEKLPLCQDTGFAVLFVELGQEVHLVGGDLREALNEGVRRGYKDGYLRKSIVADPAGSRVNTKDNTPAVIHWDIVPGDKIKITIAPKGGGSENMSSVKMMKPADGLDGIADFVVEWVRNAGGNPCPPVIVGVGIGGTFEHVAYLAKKALLRDIGSHHPDPRYADAEREILERINATGVGPMGLGGKTTALAVFIQTHPCHIASMPVAVNINCHAARHKTVIL
ncbi:MAG: fumarate hydratase [candidate division WOR-3 bacterium]|nr:fumarate hydratase [candidate division WOR-3 bacterium]